MSDDFIKRQQALIENDNVNVAKTNIGFELLWMLTFDLRDRADSDKYANKKQKLYDIQKRIVPLDSNLSAKKELKIYITEDKDINAYVMPDGTVFFTSGLLNQPFMNDEMLTFILAHEYAHYSNRDSLKAVARSLSAAILSTIVGIGTGSSVDMISNATYLTMNHYSRAQEKRADLYASAVVTKLYGNNASGIEFLEELKKNDKVPEFIYYFSTHPPHSDRIKYLRGHRI